MINQLHFSRNFTNVVTTLATDYITIDLKKKIILNLKLVDCVLCLNCVSFSLPFSYFPNIPFLTSVPFPYLSLSVCLSISLGCDSFSLIPMFLSFVFNIDVNFTSILRWPFLYLQFNFAIF